MGEQYTTRGAARRRPPCLDNPRPRSLLWAPFRLLRQSAVGTGVVMIIVAASGIMGWEVANLRVSDQVVGGILAITREPWAILLLLNGLFLVLGCLLDPIAAMIIFVPVLLPLVKQVGIDLVHFGLIVVLNLMIGLLTPPVGYLELFGVDRCMFASNFPVAGLRASFDLTFDSGNGGAPRAGRPGEALLEERDADLSHRRVSGGSP